MAHTVKVKMNERAYDLLDALAEQKGVPLGELCLQLIVNNSDISRPDLAEVPRSPMGRPRHKKLAAAE